MKKMFRTLLCVSALALMLCTSAMAADSDISIELNGDPLTFTDAAPQIVNDRTYLPFRAVFTALGFADEDITYQDATKTVSAASEELTVSMVIGENKVTVTKDGETSVLDTDVPAFIDVNLGRTYVPARFVAEAADYRVGWNGETRTVIIDDVAGILAANQETYEILDKYLDYGRTFQEKNYNVEGSYTADMDMMGDTMNMEGTYSMLMAGNTKFDFEMLMNMSGIVGGEDIGAAIPEGIDFDMRGDMGTGAFYFKSDALMTMMETGVENMWFKMDLGAMMDAMSAQTGMTYADLMTMSQEMMADLDGKAYIETMVWSMTEMDSTMSAADYLAVFNGLLGDSAYTKQGSDYVNSFEMDGATMSMIFNTSGNKVNGYKISVGAAEEGVEMLMEIAMKNSEMDAVIKMAVEGISMEMLMDGKYTATNKNPAGAPGADAAVLDIMEMMGDMLSTVPAE